MGKFAAYMLGVLTGMVLTVGGEALAVALIPTQVYLNNTTGLQIIGERYGKQGLFNLIANANDVRVSDFPIIETALTQITNDDMLKGLIEFDYEAIKDCKLTDGSLRDNIRSAIKVVATLDSVGIDLGSFANLSVFKDYKAVSPSQSDIDSNYKAYYYKDGDGKYHRAYNDDKTFVAGVTAQTQLYLPAVKDVLVTDLFTALSARVGEITIKEFLVNFLGQTEAEAEASDIYKIVGNRSLMELKDLEVASIRLIDVLPRKSSNDKLYEMLLDLTGETKAEGIVIGDLSDIDIGEVHLTTFIAYVGHEKLYRVLGDMVGRSDPTEIRLKHLDYADMGMVKLSSLVEDDGGNTILKALLSRSTPTTVSTLITDINNLSVYELFGEEVFTTDVNAALDSRKTDTYEFDEATSSFRFNDSIPFSEDTYYISQSAGLWLILAFNPGTSFTEGRANEFYPNTLTFSTLQNDPSSFSYCIGEAKVYQLVSAGILSGDYGPLVSSMSLNEAIANIGII